MRARCGVSKAAGQPVTPEQHAFFRQHGYLSVAGALGKELVQPVRAHVLAELKKQQLWAAGRSLSQRLAGVPLTPAQDAQLLISLPHRHAWSLDALNWHRDIAQARLDNIPGIQVFALLDDLVPHGGATLALAGSHRLNSPAGGMQTIARRISSAAGQPLVVDGVALSVLEMTGRAGDVYLMDMRLIHTPSINASRNVRMMATARYLAM